MHRATPLALALVALAAPATAAAQDRPYPVDQRPHSTLILRKTPEVAMRSMSLSAAKAGRDGVGIRLYLVATARDSEAPVRGVVRIAACPDARGVRLHRRCRVVEERTVTATPATRTIPAVVPRKGTGAVQVTFEVPGTRGGTIGQDAAAVALLPAVAWLRHGPAGATVGGQLLAHPRVDVTELRVDAVGIDDARYRPTIRWEGMASENAVTHWQWCWASSSCVAPPRQAPIAAGKEIATQARPTLTPFGGATGLEALRVSGWADPALSTTTAPLQPEPLFSAAVVRPRLP